LLLREIKEAGSDICSIEEVKVIIDPSSKRKSSSISICPSCAEAYRSSDGAICPACQGGVLPYRRLDETQDETIKRSISS